jgi:hypothetical protein
MKTQVWWQLVLSAILLVSLSACTIHESKQEGGDKKVEIKTPIANLNVNTDTDAKDTGLTPYPGARPKADSDHDKGRVNLSMGGESFGLKVVAASFLSDDPPEKVIDFYRKDLKRYGNVLECPKGLSESHGKDESEIRCSDSGREEPGKLELAVGVPDRQRIVSVKPSGKGTEFALVYVNIRGKDRDTL